MLEGSSAEIRRLQPFGETLAQGTNMSSQVEEQGWLRLGHEKDKKSANQVVCLG